jgi:hypothetical protein
MLPYLLHLHLESAGDAVLAWSQFSNSNLPQFVLQNG